MVDEYDVIIVGAGFSGIYFLDSFRKMGLKAHIFDSGEMLGGTWCHNRYPGARVDSSIPVYELPNPKLWSWQWTEKYPGWQELQKYFKFVGDTLNVWPDVTLKSFVTAAHYKSDENKWHVHTQDGTHAKATFFLPCVGFAAKKFVPNIKGLHHYKGECCHTSDWPLEGIDMTGRKVAIIGTGSTGIQVTQEAAAVAKELTLFQRTPNLCLPMRQEKYGPGHQVTRSKEFYENALQTFSGMQFDFVKRKTFDDTPEEREKFFDSLFAAGGFEFWLANYSDMLMDQKANDAAYDYWWRKTSVRVKDPRKREILVPKVQPHPFGTKRPSLEQNFYECFNQDNVDVVDVNVNPISEFTATGAILKDGTVLEFDLLVLATGFDSLTGSFNQIDIEGENSLKLKDKWAEQLRTNLGISVAGFPNMFFTYGPQAPTAFSNGPSCVEAQGRFILKAIKDMVTTGKSKICAEEDAEEAWTKRNNELTAHSLFPKAKSWYMGANIPGKKIEPLNYLGGLPDYSARLRESMENGYKGFEIS